jgi:hypothetical protein
MAEEMADAVSSGGGGATAGAILETGSSFISTSVRRRLRDQNW